MKRALLVVLALALIIALGATLVNAQGRWGRGQRGAGGPGKCGMMGGQGMGMGPGGCAMMGGQGMGMGMGGWWTQIQPRTPAQKQFVDGVRALHDRIRAEQAELFNLKATNGNPNRMAALETDLAALRSRLHDVLWNNQPMMQQMGVGQCGPGMAKCANCPCKDNCPSYGKAGQCVAGCQCPCVNGCSVDPAKCATCPIRDQCPTPCQKNCPAQPAK